MSTTEESAQRRTGLPGPGDARPEDVETTGHIYDGITEYDNPLPGWWKWLFVATIVFSVPYFIYYHTGTPGRTLVERYDAALAANMRLQFAEIGDLKPTRETITRYMHEESWLRIGQSVFKTNCVSCHGTQGGGLVGPNLTDEYYRNVKNIEDIATIISRGAARGAMPAWQNRLSENEIVLAASYVASLRGTDPGPGAKGPEGSEIPPWPSLDELQSADEPTDEEAADAESPEESASPDTRSDAQTAAGESPAEPTSPS